MVGVAPNEEVAEGKLLDLRFQDARPPSWVGKILIATFREGDKAVGLLGIVAKSGEVLPKSVDEGLLAVSLLISVETDDVHTVIARVRVEVITFHAVVRAPAPYDVREAIGKQVVLQAVPQRFVFLRRAESLAPPEPAAIVFVPRTEDERNGTALFVFQRLEKRGEAQHPCLELLMLTAARKNAADDSGILVVPRRAACQRVARMPGDGGDAAATHMSKQLFSDSGKGHAVQTLRIAHFDAAKLEAHYGGVITTSCQDIGMSSGSRTVVPIKSIEGIVLMSEHDATIVEAFQALEQCISSRALRTCQVKWRNRRNCGLCCICTADGYDFQVVEVWRADVAFVQGSDESCHATAIVVGCGLYHLNAINVARDAVAFEAKSEVVPLQSLDAAYLAFVQRVLASHLYVLSSEDDGLLLLVANEFLLVALAAGKNKRHLPLVVYLQIVALGPNAIAGTHVADSTHHAGLVARVEHHVGTYLVVRPAGIAEDGVVMPFGCPTERVRTYNLTNASGVGNRGLTAFRWRWHEFEAPNQVCQIVRQIAPLSRILVLLEVVFVWDREGFGSGNIVERAFLLPCCCGKGIDCIGFQRDGETAAPWGDVVQTHELLLRITVPDAEFAFREFVCHFNLYRLRLLRPLGLSNDAIVARLRVAHGNHGTAVG